MGQARRIDRRLQGRPYVRDTPRLAFEEIARGTIAKLGHDGPIKIVGILAEEPFRLDGAARALHCMGDRSVGEELQMENAIEAACEMPGEAVLQKRRQSEGLHREEKNLAGGPL